MSLFCGKLCITRRYKIFIVGEFSSRRFMQILRPRLQFVPHGVRLWDAPLSDEDIFPALKINRVVAKLAHAPVLDRVLGIDADAIPVEDDLVRANLNDASHDS